MKKWNYLLISVIIYCASCSNYQLDRSHLKTDMHIKGSLILTKYKGDTKPEIPGDNSAIIDTTVNIIVRGNQKRIPFGLKVEDIKYAIWHPENSDSIYTILPISFEKEHWYSLSCLYPEKDEPQCYTLYFTPNEDGNFEIIEYYFDGGPY